MDIQRPESLSLTRANQPYAGYKHYPPFGKLSALEHSFITGNFDEIAYWIQCGIVAEALAGKANSRRPFNTSLMQLFCYFLRGKTYLSARNSERVEVILQTLWDQAGQHHQEHWKEWMRMGAGWSIGDKILTKIETGRFQAKIDGDDLNYTLSTLQTLQQINASGEEQTSIIRDIDRMFSLALKADLPSPKNTMEVLILGGVSSETKEGTRKTSQMNAAGVLCWQRWRDQMILHGYKATMGSAENPFSPLLQSSPKKPLEVWDIRELLKQERIEKALETHQDQDATCIEKPKIESLQALYTQRRAQAWERSANAWLDVLLPTVDTTQQEENDEKQLHQQRMIFPEYLDVPGGTDLLLRAVDALKRIKSPVVFESTKTSWSGVSWIGHFQQRSFRKLKAIISLFESLGESGMSKEFRAQVASDYLQKNVIDLTTDILPSLKTSSLDYLQWRRRSKQYMEKAQKKPINPEELETLLALAWTPPKEEDSYYSTNSNIAWIYNFMRSLPGNWQLNKTKKSVRKATFDLLARHGVLTASVQFFAPLLTGLPDDEKKQQKALFEIRWMAMEGWGARFLKETNVLNDYYKEMDLALQRLGPDTQEMRKQLQIGAAYIQLMEQPPSPEELHESNTYAMRALRETAPTSNYFFTIATTELFKNMQSMKTTTWDETRIHMKSLNCLQALGWKDEIPKAAVEEICRIVVAKSSATPTDVDMFWQTLNLNVTDPSENAKILMKALLRKEEERNRPLEDWLPVVERIVDCSDVRPLVLNAPCITGGIAWMAKCRLERNSLLATIQTTEDGILEYQPNKRAPRF